MTFDCTPVSDFDVVPYTGQSTIFRNPGGEDSHVTFCVVANLMSDSNRRILTRVTLDFVSKGWFLSFERVDIQDTKTEHAQNTQLLPQRQVQVIQLPERQSHDDDIKNHIGDSGRPSLGVDVVAFKVVLAVPTQICAINRVALEDRNQNERDEVADTERHDDIGCHADLFLRKDA